MACPKGQVLFSLVIPLPPPSSAKHLSDRNLTVMLAQSFMGSLSKASIHHILLSLNDGGGQRAYQWVKGVLIIWGGGGLPTNTGPLVGTWGETKWRSVLTIIWFSFGQKPHPGTPTQKNHSLTNTITCSHNTLTSWFSGLLLFYERYFYLSELNCITSWWLDCILTHEPAQGLTNTHFHPEMNAASAH